MDRLNDRMRQMFDMVGNQITQNIRSISSQLLSTSESQSPKSVASKQSLSKRRLRNKSRRSEKSTTSRSRNKSTKSSTRSSHYNLNVSKIFAPGLSAVTNWSSDNNNLTHPSNYIKNQYQCAVYFIHCVKHQKVAVTKPSMNQALWMPFTPIPMNRSWSDAGLAGLLIILSGANMDTFIALNDKRPFSDLQLIEVCDIQMPQTLLIVTRFTWYVKMNGIQMKHFRCCQDNENVIWVDENKLNQGVIDYMWGPELIQIFRSVKDNVGVDCTYSEYNLDMAFQYLPRNPPKTEEEAMLCSSNLSEKDVDRLYNDFLEHCFPSMAMAFHSFKVYITKYIANFKDDMLTHLFLAFNYNSNGYITFPELLMGLACIDVHSVHNEPRAKFVMRYYDMEKRGYLTSNDIRQMISDMNPTATQIEIDSKLKDLLLSLEVNCNVKDTNHINYRILLSAIGNHRFRGTSKLCRSSGPIFLMISNVIFSRKKKTDNKYTLQIASVIDTPYNGVCLGCLEKKPQLAEYVISVDKDGFVMDKPKVMTLSKLSQKSVSRTKSKTEDDCQTVAKQLVKLVHEFSDARKRFKEGERPIGILCSTFREREQFYQMMVVVEKRLSALFEKESRCVSVASPAFVIGDIHGNLEDLLTLEKCIWKRFPVVGANLVFLGDYVDRGKWSVECATYLFALKILMPNKITLLRGNHEVRALQCHYTYRIECLAKYGEDYGSKIWEVTNQIFDRLSLSAVIDDVIFCAHGGIPRNTIEIADIQKQPNQIFNPEQESRLAWEILWSDPIHQQQFLEMSCLLKDEIGQKEGFLFNRKRGTAFVFNEDAANRFMSNNGLTHIIRAHEVPTNGFFFHFDKKCTTIFSCSHYCGNCNECACVLVNRDLLRVIRIDTSNNLSATDQ